MDEFKIEQAWLIDNSHLHRNRSQLEVESAQAVRQSDVRVFCFFPRLDSAVV